MSGGVPNEQCADRLAVETQIKEPAMSEETIPNHSENNHSNPYISITSPSSNDCRQNGHVVDAGRPNGYHNPNRGLVRSISEFTAGSTTDHKCVSKCTIYILQLMTVLSLLLACVSLAITTRLWEKCNDLETRISSAEGAYTAGLSDPHMCIPCDVLVQGPFPEDKEKLKDLNLIQKEENGSMTCCAKSPEQISVLLDLFVKRKQLEKCNPDTPNSTPSSGCAGEATVPPGTPSRNYSRPSAHLQIDPAKNQISNGSEKEIPIRHWSHTGKGAHLSGILLVDDRLVIPETGTYFLYSQVGFLIFYDVGTNEQAIDLANQALFHKVFRFKRTYPNDGSQELLRSELTQCWEQNKSFGRYTSYVGAALKLNKGDQLYVKVSRLSAYKHSALSSEEYLTYFGIFKLDT